MIRLQGVHKSYGTGATRLHVLKGLDLTIGSGELVSIMGASGSGKSTLLNVLGLLDAHDEWRYQLDGTEIRDLWFPAAIRTIRIWATTWWCGFCAAIVKPYQLAELEETINPFLPDPQ